MATIVIRLSPIANVTYNFQSGFAGVLFSLIESLPLWRMHAHFFTPFRPFPASTLPTLTTMPNLANLSCSALPQPSRPAASPARAQPCSSPRWQCPISQALCYLLCGWAQVKTSPSENTLANAMFLSFPHRRPLWAWCSTACRYPPASHLGPQHYTSSSRDTYSVQSIRTTTRSACFPIVWLMLSVRFCGSVVPYAGILPAAGPSSSPDWFPSSQNCLAMARAT